MDKLWIVSADETRGRIFRTDKMTGQLEEFQDLIHPQARAQEAELAHHTRGSVSSNDTIKGHSLSENGSLKEHHADVFAKEVADLLIDNNHKNQFLNLILVAPPKFLGLLRKKLDKNTAGKIRYELNKNLSKLKSNELRTHLPTVLPLE